MPVAAARRNRHPDVGVARGRHRVELRTTAAWFVYFDKQNKIVRIVQYDDTKLADDMTLRIAMASLNMQALQVGSDDSEEASE